MKNNNSDHTPRRLKTVAVVARERHNDALHRLLDAGDYDVVLIEPVDGAYSHIRQVAPQTVIVCLELDDPAAFQVVCLLKMDTATSHIPVITCVVVPPVYGPVRQ